MEPGLLSVCWERHSLISGNSSSQHSHNSSHEPAPGRAPADCRRARTAPAEPFGVRTRTTSPAGCAPPATRSNGTKLGSAPGAGAVGGTHSSHLLPAGLGKAGRGWHFPLGSPFPATHGHHHPQRWQGHSTWQIQWKKGGKASLDLSHGTERKLMLCYHCLVTAGAFSSWEKPLEQE